MRGLQGLVGVFFLVDADGSGTSCSLTEGVSEGESEDRPGGVGGVELGGREGLAIENVVSGRFIDLISRWTF